MDQAGFQKGGTSWEDPVKGLCTIQMVWHFSWILKWSVKTGGGKELSWRWKSERGFDSSRF